VGIDTILPAARSHEERIKGSETNVIQRRSAVVLQSEREKGWRLEAEGKISNAKLQSPNDKIQIPNAK
jgi:hypothetical protein